MIGIDTLAQWDKQRPLGLFNGGSADIPAFGCYEIYDSYRPDSGDALVLGGGRTVLKVRQPTADSVANFGINGLIPLPAGQSDGFGTQDYPTYAAYDTANTPAFGEEWGPQAGSCLIKKNKSGLVIYGDQNGTIVRVARKLSPAAKPYVSGLNGTATLTDFTTQDVAFTGYNVQGSEWSVSTASGVPEFTWTGPETEFVSIVTCYFWANNSAPSADTDLIAGLRGDAGLGYLPNMQGSPLIWINHRFISGTTPPARSTLTAMYPLRIATGTKYKMSAQKYPFGDGGFQINLYNCTMTIFKAY